MSVDKIEEALSDAAQDGFLSCAAAFEVAAAQDVSPQVVGEYADRLGLHLNQCQLGLFGYPPHKKIVSPLERVDAELAAAIQEGLGDGCLPCRTAWSIADRLKIRRMQVSAACETMNVKIKPCQIGAF